MNNTVESVDSEAGGPNAATLELRDDRSGYDVVAGIADGEVVSDEVGVESMVHESDLSTEERLLRRFDGPFLVAVPTRELSGLDSTRLNWNTEQHPRDPETGKFVDPNPDG